MKTTTEIIAMVNALAFAASSEDAPTGWWTAISIDDLRAAANRLAELERENARMRAALGRVRSELEMHINWKPTGVAVEVAIAFEIAREALAGSGEK